MTAPKIVVRVRATLHRQGFQGFTQEQIIETAQTLTVDLDNPSPEDTKKVASYLMENFPKNNIANSSKITVPDSGEVFQRETNTEDEQKDSEEINHHMLANLPRQEMSQSGKEAMVTRVARDLNVDISRDAIINIASQFDAGIKNAQEQRQALETAIIAYLDYQIAQEQSEQNQSISRMVDSYKTSVTALNQNLNDFTSELNTALEVGRDANKSAFADLLKQFAIPSSKA